MADKKRSQNFTPSEVEILMDLVKSRWSIIECKKTDVCTWQDKTRCWLEIEKLFNANNTSNPVRPVTVLRKKWDNIKKTIKSKGGRPKHHVKVTGGGPPLPEVPLSQMEQDILDRLNGQVIGLTGDVDNDGDSLPEVDFPQRNAPQVLPTWMVDGVAGTSVQDPLEPEGLCSVKRNDSDSDSVWDSPTPQLLQSQIINPRLKIKSLSMRKRLQDEKGLMQKKLAAELKYIVNMEKREAEAHALRLKREAEEHELKMNILKRKLELLNKR